MTIRRVIASTPARQAPGVLAISTAAELAVYDETGQLLSGTLMDYAIPHADDVPAFASAILCVPCRTTPPGIKDAGEAGAIGAPPAVIHAVVDALSPFGIRHMDMPATSLRMWRAIRNAKAKP